MLPDLKPIEPQTKKNIELQNTGGVLLWTIGNGALTLLNRLAKQRP
jgi:hypothetical protein